MALFRQKAGEVLKQRIHPPHNLHALRAIVLNFNERKFQEIFPAWRWDNQPEHALTVTKSANFQLSAAEAQEQVLELIQRLNGGRGIVNGGGKRFDGDVHNEPDGVLGILFERSFLANLDGVFQ